MKVVLDTNVWLSAIFWKGEAYKIVELCIKNKINIMMSQNIIKEIVNVLNKEEKFQRSIIDRNEKIEDLIRTILSISNLIETKSKLDIVKDNPKENIILEVALDGKVDYIISYDKHLLNMLEFREIKIMQPNDFLKTLKS